MAPRPNVSLNSPNKPSKLLALVALVVAFSLPFILVKSFPHKNKSLVTSIPQPLPAFDNTSTPDEVEPVNAAPKTAELPPPLSTTASPIPPKPKPVTVKPLPARSAAPETKPLAAVKPVASQTAEKSEWTIIKTRENDSLSRVFSRAGLSTRTLRAVLKGSSHTKILSKLQANEELQLLIKHHDLEKMIIPFTATQYVTIYRERAAYKSTITTRKMNSHNHFLTATIHGSLYGTAKRQNIPYKLIQQMSEIFTWDIDFAKDVKEGDKFTIVYKAFYIENKLVSTGDIIAVSYKTRSNLYQAVRHTNRAGFSDYYTPQGKSLKNAFTRYPLRFSHISSTFSLSRYHPVLHYRRAHKGVDLAARIGTPIQATGDGQIEIIGRQNGYGNMIKIKHNKTYSSIYGHMLKFQKGLSRGDYVKRGQVIGYVGQTGLASGPHCHYEFHVNNQPKNPTTIDLPRGDPISGRELGRFRANTTTLLAQLKLFEDAHLASAAKNSARRG